MRLHEGKYFEGYELFRGALSRVRSKRASEIWPKSWRRPYAEVSVCMVLISRPWLCSGVPSRACGPLISCFGAPCVLDFGTEEELGSLEGLGEHVGRRRECC
jgi:hypothetical protein